jgi:hypothetical protein
LHLIDGILNKEKINNLEEAAPMGEMHYIHIMNMDLEEIRLINLVLK